MFVFTHPASAEQDGEFNRWYDEQHLADVLAVPGIVAASRFRLSSHQRGPIPEETAPYLALYELETPDLKGCVEEIGRRGGTELMPISATMGLEGALAPQVLIYESC